MPAPSPRIDDYYVRYLGGPHRDWGECRCFGFVSGDGPRVRSNMRLLEPGVRIWVYAPKYEAKHGYVGVGIVSSSAVPLVEFEVRDENGELKRVVDLPTRISGRAIHALSPRKAEHVIGVTWEKTVDVADAVFERGFFTRDHPLPFGSAFGLRMDGREKADMARRARTRGLHAPRPPGLQDPPGGVVRIGKIRNGPFLILPIRDMPPGRVVL
ncbi:MAG: hypothetical protein WCP98_11300 [Actinomycetes bacterium]